MNAPIPHHPLAVVRAARERAGRVATARLARVGLRIGRTLTKTERRLLLAARSGHDWLAFRAERRAAGRTLSATMLAGRPYLRTI